MSDTPRTLKPPTPIGEPFRADPSDPAPFVDESQFPATPGGPPTWQTPLPTHRAQQGPTFLRPGEGASPTPPRQLTPEQRFGRTAFWTGIASIFLFNLILGPVAIIMGAMAVTRGEKRLGQLAMLFGLLGTVIGVALLYLVAEGVLPDLDELMKDLRNQR